MLLCQTCAFYTFSQEIQAQSLGIAFYLIIVSQLQPRGPMFESLWQYFIFHYLKFYGYQLIRPRVSGIESQWPHLFMFYVSHNFSQEDPCSNPSGSTHPWPSSEVGAPSFSLFSFSFIPRFLSMSHVRIPPLSLCSFILI